MIPALLTIAALIALACVEIVRANRRQPFFRQGPTHQFPSRDSDRQRGINPIHNEGI